MTNPVLLKQVYYPADTDGQRDDKCERLIPSLRREFPVEVIVRRFAKKRSPEANAYLWGVCYPLIADASGYEKEEVHYVMCCKHFGTKVVEVMGESFTRPVRTTTTNEDGEAEWLNVMEFAEFVDFVIREAALWYDVAIPPPTPKDVPR